MNTSEVISILKKYEPRSFHTQLPIVWNSAQGYHVRDQDGKVYLDFTSGIFTANCGHANEYIAEAIRSMSEHLIHSYSFATEIRAKLVKKLCEMTGYEKVFLCSTGSEAVEAAIRVIIHNRADGSSRIIALNGSFHGNTQGSRMLQYGGLTYTDKPGFQRYPPYGLILETYYGWSAQFHPKEWVQEWVNWAKEHIIPVCFDEVQAGFGRTGKLFGYEWYDVKPDLVVVGKALGNGLPISAVLGSAELLDAPDDLSSTHSGNPICCASALATLEYISSHKLIERSAENEAVFLDELLNIPYPRNGHGMIWAIIFPDDELPKRIVARCAEKGLLLIMTHRNSIKLGPPLIMPIEVIREGMSILKEVINEIAPCGNSCSRYG